MTTGWSELGPDFLSVGSWAVGQGPDAPDRQLFRALVAATPTQSILEVGFGPCIDTEALTAANLLDGRRYIGYDHTPELVERARNRFPEHRFQVQDVLSMTDEKAHDVIWVRHVLEHVADGERALQALWRACRWVLVLSWFIRPSFAPHEVGCVEGDGFPHHTYSAPRWIALATELGAHLTRIDFDHHLNRASVWILTRGSHPDVTETATSFAQSPEFLAALLPVPERIDEQAVAALDHDEATHAAITNAIPLLETIPDLHLVVADELDSLTHTEAFLRPVQDEREPGLLMVRVRDAKARAEALGGDDPLRGEKVQALRDSCRVIETRLREAGRLADA